MGVTLGRLRDCIGLKSAGKHRTPGDICPVRMKKYVQTETVNLPTIDIKRGAKNISL